MIMNRKNISFLIILFVSFILMINVNAETTEIVAENFCTDMSKTLQLVGFFLVVVKIVVPLLVVIMGSLDFYHIVMSGKDSDLKKEALILGKRVLMGVIVFLMPTIVNLAVNTLDNNPNADYKVCVDCLTKPSSCPVKNK